MSPVVVMKRAVSVTLGLKVDNSGSVPWNHFSDFLNSWAAPPGLIPTLRAAEGCTVGCNVPCIVTCYQLYTVG